MFRRVGSVILARFSCAFVPGSGFARIDEAGRKQHQQDRSTPESKAKAEVKSMTGCVDERGRVAKYLMIDANARTLIANPKVAGFPNEGFADSSANPLMKVRPIETVSDGGGKKQ